MQITRILALSRVPSSTYNHQPALKCSKCWNHRTLGHVSTAKMTATLGSLYPGQKHCLRCPHSGQGLSPQVCTILPLFPSPRLSESRSHGGVCNPVNNCLVTHQTENNGKRDGTRKREILWPALPSAPWVPRGLCGAICIYTALCSLPGTLLFFPNQSTSRCPGDFQAV